MYKSPQTIFDCIRIERQDYLYAQIEIVPGYTFNQNFNIQKIHKYYNSHYYDGDYETVNGIMRKRVFWNLGKRRATIASKQIDIDTKDFLLISKNHETEWNVNLLEKELKAWLKRSSYGKILNQIADELPVYGSVILRKTKDGAELADLRYTFLEQSAPSLDKSRYLIFKHLMTPETMREMEGTWDNVQKAIDQFAITSTKSYENGGQLNIQHTTPEVEVYERFGEVPLSFFDNDGMMNETKDDAEYVYARWIVAGVDAITQVASFDGSTQQIHAPGIVLFKEQLKKEDAPFKEVHYRKTKGRWQGIGVIEDTFEDQRMINKTKDQEDKAQELAALILFQTATDMAAKNVLTDVDNGEILKSTSPINRLDNENKSFVAMQKIAENYETHADRETFSADMLGGEKAPASATLGAVNAQLATSASIYDYKKENFGLFLQEFISDLVFPELEKEIIKESHVLRYAGNMFEMQKIREKMVEGYLREQILKTGDIPTQEEYEAKKQEFVQGFLKHQGSKLWIQTERDFFKGVKNGYEVSLEITGESKNVQQWLSNLQQVLSLVTTNPLILQNPLYKRIFYKMLSAMGMSTSELEDAEMQITPDMIETMVRMGTKRSMQTKVNVDDKTGQFAQPVLQQGAMIPNQPQQQQGGVR